MSASCTIDVTSVATSLTTLDSPPPLTVTVFVTLAVAFDPTLIVSVMAGAAAPGAMTVVRVQRTGAPREQLQPAPLAAVAVNAGGSASETVNTPAVDPVPTLDTCSV